MIPPAATTGTAAGPPAPASAAVAQTSAATAPEASRPAAPPQRQGYIVQARSAGEAGAAVVRAGGRVTGDLSIIRAVSAELAAGELEALRQAEVPALEVYLDAPVTASFADTSFTDPTPTLI